MKDDTWSVNTPKQTPDLQNSASVFHFSCASMHSTATFYVRDSTRLMAHLKHVCHKVMSTEHMVHTGVVVW